MARLVSTMARPVAVFLVLASLILGALPANAQATCTRSEFEQVVEEAGTMLRALAAEFRPAFQDKLRLLREKRGWSHDEFVLKAAPFVRDDTIVALDQKSNAILADIGRLGEDSAASEGPPDCALLDRLRTAFDEMVASQKEKWRYMFAKIDAELAR